MDLGGPYTRVPLFGWRSVFNRRCSTASLIPILTLLVFCTDIVLSFFAGFDLVNRGTDRPWIQFSLSLGVAFLYSTLAVVVWVMYGWERMLRFRYHWVFGLGVSAIVAWINFGVWASWQTRFSSFVGHVESSDGNAFVTWVAANAVGIAGFLLRFVVLCVAQAIRHVYDRMIEVQNRVYAQSSGGKSIYEGLAAISSRFGRMQHQQHLAAAEQGRRYHWNLAQDPAPQSAPRIQNPFLNRFAGTKWANRSRNMNNNH